MVLGLLAPELVVWNAWEQRKKVKELSELMRKKGFMSEESKAPWCVSRWYEGVWHRARITLSPSAEDAHQLTDLTSTGSRQMPSHIRIDVRSWFVLMGYMKAQVLLAPRTEVRHDPLEVVTPRMRNERVNAWTDVHSWLVVMGGMACEDTSPENQEFMPGTQRRFTITLDMFEWMVRTRPHLVPDISRGYIEDKSKSD